MTALNCLLLEILQGHLRLVQALSALYSKVNNRKIDPLTEILVTCGAYEALFDSVLGFVIHELPLQNDQIDQIGYKCIIVQF